MISLHPSGLSENYSSTDYGGAQQYNWLTDPLATTPIPFTAPPGHGTGFYGLYNGVLQNGHSYQDGTVTVRAVWTPPYAGAPSQPPPQRLVLRLESSASWGKWPYGVVTVTESVADDGLGDPEIPQWDTGGVSSGKHIRVCDGSSGVVEFPVALKARIAARGASPADGASLDTQINFGAYQDDRRVVLHRLGARNEWEDANGVTHGDTRYSYQHDVVTPPYLVPVPWDIVNWQEFQALYTGSWPWKSGQDHNGNAMQVPDVDWSWNPDESEDTWDYGKWSMRFGNVDYDLAWEPRGVHTPATTRTMTYTATDRRDGAQYTASYALTLHDEWDNQRVCAPPTPKHKVIYGPNGPYWQNGPCVPSVEFAITGTVELAISLTGSFTSGAARTFGIEVSPSLSVSVELKIGVVADHIDETQHTFPYILAQWNTNHYLVDKYDNAGFIGTFPQDIDDAHPHLSDGWAKPRPLLDFTTNIGYGGI